MTRKHLAEFQDPEHNARAILAIFAASVVGLAGWSATLWLIWVILA